MVRNKKQSQHIIKYRKSIIFALVIKCYCRYEQDNNGHKVAQKIRAEDADGGRTDQASTATAQSEHYSSG